MEADRDQPAGDRWAAAVNGCWHWLWQKLSCAGVPTVTWMTPLVSWRGTIWSNQTRLSVGCCMRTICRIRCQTAGSSGGGCRGAATACRRGTAGDVRVVVMANLSIVVESSAVEQLPDSVASNRSADSRRLNASHDVGGRHANVLSARHGEYSNGCATRQSRHRRLRCRSSLEQLR